MELTPAERIRAQTKEATRKALLDAGLVETIERGGEVPSIEVICSRAGYTRGAFYMYFKDRDAFIAEMLEWVLGDIIYALFVTTAQSAATLDEVILGFNAALELGEWPDLHNNIRVGYLAILRELRPESKVRQQHADLMQSIANRLEELVQEGQQARKIRKDVDARRIAMLLLLSAIGAIMFDDIGIAMDPPAMGKATLKLLAAPE